MFFSDFFSPFSHRQDSVTALSSSKIAVFDIPEPSDTLYLALSVSRVIQGEDGDKEFMKYCTRQEEMKAKHIDKYKGALFQSFISSSSSYSADCAGRVDALGRFKEIFAFEALPLFSADGKQKLKGNVTLDKIKFHKFEKDIFEVIEGIADDVEVP